jgi:hypothetical protein
MSQMAARHANWRSESRFLYTQAEPKLVSGIMPSSFADHV